MSLPVSSYKELKKYFADKYLYLLVVDTETVIAEEKKDERARYISLVREIERFLSDGLVKERMEIDTLGECGILRHPKKFFTTVIKLKTKLL